MGMPGRPGPQGIPGAKGMDGIPGVNGRDGSLGPKVRQRCGSGTYVVHVHTL